MAFIQAGDSGIFAPLFSPLGGDARRAAGAQNRNDKKDQVTLSDGQQTCADLHYIYPIGRYIYKKTDISIFSKKFFLFKR